MRVKALWLDVFTMGSFALGWLVAEDGEDIMLGILLGFFSIHIVFGGEE